MAASFVGGIGWNLRVHKDPPCRLSSTLRGSERRPPQCSDRVGAARKQRPSEVIRRALNAGASTSRSETPAVADETASASPSGDRHDGRLIDDLEFGELVRGKVVRSGPGQNVWIECGVVRRAKGGRIVPLDGRLKPDPVHGDGDPPPTVGSSIIAVVWRAQPDSARLELARLPRLRTYQARRRRWENASHALESLSPAEPLSAEVRALLPDGSAIVDVGVHRAWKKGKRRPLNALLRRRHFASEWLSDRDVVRKSEGGGVAELSARQKQRRVVKEGDALTVYVRTVNVQSARLEVGGVAVGEEDLRREREAHLLERRRMARRRRRKRLPSAGALMAGNVLRTTTFGVFVGVGHVRTGLLHWKRMPKKLHYSWREVLPAGTPVGVEVESVDNEAGHMQLRLVSLLGEDEEELYSEGTQAEDSQASLSSPAALRRSGDVERTSKEDPLRGRRAEIGETEEYEEDDDESDDLFDDEYFEEKYG